jgi:hypothetical protein
MQAAAITRWSGIVPGREVAARRVMQDVSAFYDKLVAAGRITGYAWYISPTAGDGLLVARGEADQLAAVEQEPEAMTLTMRSIHVCTDFGGGLYLTGDSVEPLVALFVETAAGLG